MSAAIHAKSKEILGKSQLDTVGFGHHKCIKLLPDCRDVDGWAYMQRKHRHLEAHSPSLRRPKTEAGFKPIQGARIGEMRTIH